MNQKVDHLLHPLVLEEIYYWLEVIQEIFNWWFYIRQINAVIGYTEQFGERWILFTQNALPILIYLEKVQIHHILALEDYIILNDSLAADSD